MTRNPEKSDDREDLSQESCTSRIQLPSGQGGILSDSDRRFLLRDNSAFPDLNWEGNETQKRWRIREKVKTALSDFQLLNLLDQKDKSLIFNDVFEDDDLPEHLKSLNSPTDQFLNSPDRQVSYYNPSALGEQYSYLQEAIIFLYTACELNPGPGFERLLEDSIQRYISNYSGTSNSMEIKNVSVNVAIEKTIEWSDLPNIDELERKLERGESLTREEIGELFIQGRIKSEDLSSVDIEP